MAAPRSPPSGQEARPGPECQAEAKIARRFPAPRRQREWRGWPKDPQQELTRLLGEVREGRDGAGDRLYRGVHSELLSLARRAFRRESPGHTLQPTALVNEAWMRLAPSEADFRGRAHFFGAAARAMRQILIDHARRAQAAKRGGADEPVTLTEVPGEENPLSVLEVEDALQALEQHDARLAEIVQLRFFGGLSIDEAAAALELSPATVKRDWTYARAWLFDRMGRGRDAE